MPKKEVNSKDIYEIMENDDGEIMLLLYAGEQAPQKSTFYINTKKKNIELYRNTKDTVVIEGLAEESLEKLKNIEILYICEMKYNENPNSENEIIYAYTATPEKESLAEKNKKEASISDKAKQAREKITHKA